MDDLLAAVARYTTLPADEVGQLRRVARPATFARHRHLFQPPEVCRHLFFILSGLVRCYYLFEDREVNLRLLCDGSAALPLSSYLTQTPTFEYVQCLTEAQGYIVPLPANGAAGLEQLRRVLAERHYLSMQRRLLTLQYKTARQRYRYFQQHMEAKIVRDTPALHIASYLGLRPESLSRIRRAT